MPRRRTQYRRKTDAIPDAFPQRQHASGLPWAEIARRLGVAPLTIRRWRYKGVIRRELIHVDTGMMALKRNTCTSPGEQATGPVHQNRFLPTVPRRLGGAARHQDCEASSLRAGRGLVRLQPGKKSSRPPVNRFGCPSPSFRTQPVAAVQERLRRRLAGGLGSLGVARGQPAPEQLSLVRRHTLAKQQGLSELFEANSLRRLRRPAVAGGGLPQ